MAYTVRINKDRFKFSATHFTIFSETQAEALHGHNYQVCVDILFKSLDPETGISAEFSELKEILQTLCDQLDEKILLPANSPFVKIGEAQDNKMNASSSMWSIPALSALHSGFTRTLKNLLVRLELKALKFTSKRLKANL